MLPPWLHDLFALANSAGGMAGLAAIIAALSSLRRREASTDAMKRDVASVKAQVEHNHGSSLRDSVDRIEASLATLSDRVESLDHRIGHEMGDMRRSADTTHADLAARIRHLEEKHS